MSSNVKLFPFRVSSALLTRITTVQNGTASYNDGNRVYKSSMCQSLYVRNRVNSKAKDVKKLTHLLRPEDNVAVVSSFMPLNGKSKYSTSAAPQAAGTGCWDLYAGVVVERKPVLTQKRDAFQEKYYKVLNQIEYETSKKSDHEIRKENDIKLLEKVKAGEAELGNVTTARDDEDKWTAEAQQFVPAKRETEADLKNDVKSLERALDSHLLLVVEQRLGKDYKWICPHAKLEPGENLKQAAERMIRDVFPDMKTKVLGNAPWGFYKYKYPKDTATEKSVGAKVFFYKAQVVSGQPTISEGNKGELVKDFVWLKRDELPRKLQLEYYKKLSECLIDE